MKLKPHIEKMMNGLDLFSGYGGISLGLGEYVRPVTYCEIERYAQGILLSRMESGELPVAPIWDDVTTLNGSVFTEQIDIIYGGFPCQDISVAGNGKGLAGKRSGLFFEVCRLVEEIQPPFVFLENVPAIRNRGLLEVVNQFTNLRYDCRWTRVSAQEIGAPHIRERWFFLAYTNHDRRWEKQISKQGRKDTSEPWNDGSPQHLANSNGPGLEGACREKSEFSFAPLHHSKEWWETEPNVGRVVDGCPARMDRIKALGNGVVPLQVKTAFERLMGIEVQTPQ